MYDVNLRDAMEVLELLIDNEQDIQEYDKDFKKLLSHKNNKKLFKDDAEDYLITKPTTSWEYPHLMALLGVATNFNIEQLVAFYFDYYGISNSKLMNKIIDDL